MPYRRKMYRRKRRPYKKRRGMFKKKRRPKKDIIIYRSPYKGTASAFPREYHCVLPFRTNVTSEGTGSSFVLVSFTPSDIFGLNAVSFNALYATLFIPAIYQNFVVKAYSWKLTAINLDTVAPMEFAGLAMPTVDDPPADWSECAYQTGVVEQLLTQSGRDGSRGRAGGYVNLTKLTGVNVTQNPDYWGTDTVTPAKVTKLYICANGLEPSPTTAHNWNFTLILKLYVKFFNRLEMTNP